MGPTFSIRSRSEAETEAAGQRLAGELQAGAVVLLAGELGTGKTVFVRGLVKGLGVDPAGVSSPTFTLIHEYRGGRLPVYHADLYRLTAPEADDLGLDELAEMGGVLAIEWPDRLAWAPAGSILVRIDHAGGDARIIAVGGQDAAHSER